MLSDCKLCYICGKMCPKGMKRLNYYQVHKNKKPKRLKFRKPNGLAAGSAFIISKYIVDRSIISASIFNSAAEKLLALAESTIHFANAINDVAKKQRATRYLRQHEPARSSR